LLIVQQSGSTTDIVATDTASRRPLEDVVASERGRRVTRGDAC
jgi:hypothetical protein